MFKGHKFVNKSIKPPLVQLAIKSSRRPFSQLRGVVPRIHNEEQRRGVEHMQWLWSIQGQWSNRSSTVHDRGARINQSDARPTVTYALELEEPCDGNLACGTMSFWPWSRLGCVKFMDSNALWKDRVKYQGWSLIAAILFQIVVYNEENAEEH